MNRKKLYDVLADLFFDRAAQRELSPVLGPPVQKVPGFLSAWFPEKLQFSLMIVEDEQPPTVVFFLKEPLVEGM